MPTRGEKDGVMGYAHVINGEARFIPDDPANSPAADMGPIDAAVVGFGETIENTGLRLDAALDTLTGQENTQAQRDFQDVKTLLAPLEEDHGFAIAMGQSIPGFFAPSSKIAQSVTGAAEGALASPEHPKTGALIGAAGGLIGGALGQRLANRMTARMAGPVGRLASRNIPTTVAQRTGAPAEQHIEAGLQAIPIVSSWAARPVRAQQEALNRGVASVFGYEGALTKEGLGTVRSGIKTSFNEVQAAIPDQAIDDALFSRLDDLGVMDDATKEFYEQTGIFDGQALMEMRSNLNSDMADAFMGNMGKEGRRLRAALTEMDALIEESIGGTMTQQWQTARKQWQFLTAVTRGKAISGDGTVNLRSMNTALESIYPGFRFGDDLPSTAQGFGELVSALDQLPKAMQSSGTAEREGARAMFTNGIQTLATSPLSISGALRAAGQEGVAEGATPGIAGATQLTGPIADAVQAILDAPDDRIPSDDGADEPTTDAE